MLLHDWSDLTLESELSIFLLAIGFFIAHLLRVPALSDRNLLAFLHALHLVLRQIRIGGPLPVSVRLVCRVGSQPHGAL